jgi:hypothetical protein
LRMRSSHVDMSTVLKVIGRLERCHGNGSAKAG